MRSPTYYYTVVVRMSLFVISLWCSDGSIMTHPQPRADVDTPVCSLHALSVQILLDRLIVRASAIRLCGCRAKVTV